MTITGDYLFLGLIILASVLNFTAIRANLLLFRMAAAISWLTLGILLWTGALSTSMSDPWTQALGFVFILMTVAPLTLQMVTETKREAKGQFWTEWRRNVKETKRQKSLRTQKEYKDQLRSLRGKHR